MGRYRERDDAIIKSRQAGASFAKLSREFGLSKNRVRKIFTIKLQDINYLPESPFKPLGLSKRLLRALTNSDFKTIEQIANTSDEEMLKIPQVGKVGLLEIKKALVNWRSTCRPPSNAPRQGHSVDWQG
jgi:DNA-directed RNA polymerase alpha subunit